MRSALACAVLLSSVLLGCSVGTGSGSVTGSVRIDECRLDTADFSLEPTFFAGEFVVDPELIDATERLRYLNIRIQRGSWREGYSDGLMVSVADVNELEGMLGTPIELHDEASDLVHLAVYLGQSCLSGFPDNHWTSSAILPATAGTITFTDIYAPGLGDTNALIAATFEDVVFVDDRDPEGRTATLSGDFAFVYQRGRPAQHFQ